MGLQAGIYLIATIAASISTIAHSSYRENANVVYERLLDSYERDARPCKASWCNHQALIINFTASLIQILDVVSPNEKLQTFSSILWLELSWIDYRLRWNPDDFDGISFVHLPADLIWLPDLVVYNSAYGSPHIETQSTKVYVQYDGHILWKPPKLVQAFCKVRVGEFPYDSQMCHIKFGTWSYEANYVDLHITRMYHAYVGSSNNEGNRREVGLDLAHYRRSQEWNIMKLTAVRNELAYAGSDLKYVDITFDFHLKRLPLFYSANMMLPCGAFVSSGILTIFAFVLPANSKQRMMLCMSILLSLCWFWLLLVDIVPASSLGFPIIGRYILFNMFSIATAIVMTVFTLRIRLHDPAVAMSAFARDLFIDRLAYVLGVGNPELSLNYVPKMRSRRHTHRALIPTTMLGTNNLLTGSVAFAGKQADQKGTATPPYYKLRLAQRADSDCSYAVGAHDRMQDLEQRLRELDEDPIACRARDRGDCEFQIIIKQALNVQYIADTYRRKARELQVANEWALLAEIADRIFMLIYTAFTLLVNVWLISRQGIVAEEEEPLGWLPAAQSPLGCSSHMKRWN